MQLKDILKRPIVTEKSKILELKWKYTVEVDAKANKTQVKQAFERTYAVNVEGVNILVNRAKYKYAKKGTVVKRPTLTKAMVTLKKWQKIDFVNLKIKD